VDKNSLYFVYLQHNKANPKNPYDLIPLVTTNKLKQGKDTSLPATEHPQLKLNKELPYFTLSATSVFSFVGGRPFDIMSLTDWLEERQNFNNLCGLTFFKQF
jgi:hypothetical protein